jgi:hypothetical protein
VAFRGEETREAVVKAAVIILTAAKAVAKHLVDGGSMIRMIILITAEARGRIDGERKEKKALGTIFYCI